MAKRKRKRNSKKKLSGKERRIKDATRWLQSRECRCKSLVESYAKRYAVSEQTACLELMELGYYDEICIQNYESEGVEWEYRVDGRSGDMFVVPKGSEEHEMYEIHGIL